jgi:putative transposase
MRLTQYDYSWAGWYYVTICVKGRKCFLGEIVGERMHLNRFGEIILWHWQCLPRHYPDVELDEFVIMPNILHGFIIITGTLRRGGSRTAPTGTKTKTLGRLIGAFKTMSTKEINTIRKTNGAALWQRSFYDHIIRNDSDLYRIRTYIENNPLQWALDEENPENIGNPS